MKLISPSICRWAWCLLLATVLLPQANGAYDFVTTGSMLTARSAHTATSLADGKVLVAGGCDSSGTYHSSAEIYDPATETWSFTGSTSKARGYHTASLLTNGKVLIVGGGSADGLITSTELYDPATGLWSTTGSMATGRSDHTATLLTNGKVLVAGGDNGGGSGTSSAELYDPATGLWSATSSMVTGHNLHTATLLANGKVLVTGGYGSNILSSTELYDPATGLWNTASLLANARYAHTATQLANGKVLVAGGFNDNSGPLTGAELYDPATGLWSTTGSLGNARYFHTATLLPNGKVLIAENTGRGNSNYGMFVSSAELYDPATGLWSTIPSLANVRGQHTATLMSNGKVLVAGGYDNSGPNSSAELFQSDSLWGGDYFYSAHNGVATITAYRGTGGAVTLPTTIEGIPVTSIDNNAFFCNTNLTSVTIPNSITSIGSYAFSSSGLTSLSIPNSVTSIGEYAFQGCSGMTSLTIGSGITSINSTMFAGISGLKSLSIPYSVTHIASGAFADCSGVTSLKIPYTFLASLSAIGFDGPVATSLLIDGIARNLSTNMEFINALAGNDAFVTAVANKIKSTSGNYGIATQSALSSALTESRADGINSVLSNPSLWTLYTTSQIQNMAVGDLVLTKNVQGGFTLNYDIEQSTDLQTWTPYQAFTLPLTGLPTDKAFVRIKAKP